MTTNLIPSFNNIFFKVYILKNLTIHVLFLFFRFEKVIEHRFLIN
jgi:hypothetical protein